MYDVRCYFHDDFDFIIVDKIVLKLSSTHASTHDPLISCIFFYSRPDTVSPGQLVLRVWPSGVFIWEIIELVNNVINENNEHNRSHRWCLQGTK